MKTPYLSVPGPGARLGRPGDGVPEAADVEAGHANFLVILVAIRRMEWLRLAPTGNLSARFEWDRAGALAAHWIVP
jgi:hypothetical protein